MNKPFQTAIATSALILAGHTGVTGQASEVYERIVCPSTLELPRHDHQNIIKMKGGRLLLAWTECYPNRPSRITRLAYSGLGGSSNVESRRISGRISDDAGRTWSAKFVMLDVEYPVRVEGSDLLRLPSGEILLFYCNKYTSKDQRIFMKRSSDECETWSKPVHISNGPSGPGDYRYNHGRAMQLSSGRILLPIWWAPQVWRGGYVSFCLYSDDEGKTWTEAKGKVGVPEDKRAGLAGAQEPSVVELKDGSLFMVLRTNLGKIYKAHSHDAGETWTKATPTELDAPNSEHLVKRIPKTGDLLLVWNHDKPYKSAPSLPRSRLTAAISTDEGQSWTHFRDIEHHAGYDCAYPAVTFVEDEALITYYYGNRDDNHGWESVKLKIVPISWFYNSN